LTAAPTAELIHADTTVAAGDAATDGGRAHGGATEGRSAGGDFVEEVGAEARVITFSRVRSSRPEPEPTPSRLTWSETLETGAYGGLRHGIGTVGVINVEYGDARPTGARAGDGTTGT